MERKLKNSIKGQALVETLVILTSLIALLSLFFIYIYKASVLTWTQYQLNEALYCEQTKILQTNEIQKNTSNEENSLELKTNEKVSKTKRQNHNCLVNAKNNISLIISKKNLDVFKNKNATKYGVNFKWENVKKASISAEYSDPTLKNNKSKQLDLLSRLFSFFSQ